MDSALTSVGLPAALAIIMFGLGLSLTVGDFARVAKAPKAVSIALICQLLLLPAAAFGLVTLFDLDPLLAVGMMLLAASPGGTTANLFSHLFRGDVALNVTLTAVNSVFAVVLIPVALGMWVRLRSSAFAERMDKPVRIGSAVVLALVIVGTVISERENIADYLVDIGVVAALFCLLSLSIGHRQFHGNRHHNSTLAITIAVSLLGNVQLAVPAAVYGVLMFPLAAAFGATITRKSRTMAEID
ncbi:unnamed protein product, partial [Mesorhabditis spiculigera]